MLIRESEEEASGNDTCTETDTIIKLESNIDDCTGETLGYVMELLYEAGAREANYMPVFMKKNRPACKLEVLCKEEKVSALEEVSAGLPDILAQKGVQRSWQNGLRPEMREL